MADENIDSGMTVGLEEEIMADLTAELSIADPKFNPALLLPKVRNAMREVKRARGYPESYTSEQIETDMYNYYSNIRNIALYDYNQIGNEFSSSSSENSVGVHWIDRNKLFAGIYAFVKVL